MKWGYINFLEAVNDITGGNRKFQSSEYLSAGRYPIVDQSDLFIGGYTNEEDVVRRNSPVVVFGDHTKCLKYVEFDFCLGADGVKILEPKVATLDTKFLYYYLMTINLPDVGYSRHYKFLKEIQIPLPPLPIQKRIAEILDAADALRKKDQELLKKYDELAQAIFIDMFGDPVKNEKGWEVKCLGELIEITSSKRIFKNEYVSEGIPFYRTKEIVELSKNHKISIELFISQNRYNEIASSNDIPQIGDILISAVGTIGVMWIVDTDEPFYFKDGNLVWLKLSSNAELCPTYLKVALEHLIKNQQYALAEGAAYSALTIEKLKAFELPVPVLSEQRLFEFRINQLQEVRSKMHIECEKSSILFTSLLIDAFNSNLIS